MPTSYRTAATSAPERYHRHYKSRWQQELVPSGSVHTVQYELATTRLARFDSRAA